MTDALPLMITNIQSGLEHLQATVNDDESDSVENDSTETPIDSGEIGEVSPVSVCYSLET